MAILVKVHIHFPEILRSIQREFLYFPISPAHISILLSVLLSNPIPDLMENHPCGQWKYLYLL
jgi:hypothetical protein